MSVLACASDLVESPSMRISPTASNTSRESVKSSPEDAMMSESVLFVNFLIQFSDIWINSDTLRI